MTPSSIELTLSYVIDIKSNSLSMYPSLLSNLYTMFPFPLSPCLSRLFFLIDFIFFQRYEASSPITSILCLSSVEDNASYISSMIVIMSAALSFIGYLFSSIGFIASWLGFFIHSLDSRSYIPFDSASSPISCTYSSTLYPLISN